MKWDNVKNSKRIKEVMRAKYYVSSTLQETSSDEFKEYFRSYICPSTTASSTFFMQKLLAFPFVYIYIYIYIYI